VSQVLIGLSQWTPAEKSGLGFARYIGVSMYTSSQIRRIEQAWCYAQAGREGRSGVARRLGVTLQTVRNMDSELNLEAQLGKIKRPSRKCSASPQVRHSSS
jgi:hypothetical protein